MHKEGMERILVPVVSGRRDTRLIIHGIQLAERIGGTIYILEIDHLEEGSPAPTFPASRQQNHEGASLTAKSGGEESRCEFFQTRGEYCDEIINFCSRFRITNLVLDLTSAGKRETPVRMLEMINSLKQRLGCRVELIGKKHKKD